MIPENRAQDPSRENGERRPPGGPAVLMGLALLAGMEPACGGQAAPRIQGDLEWTSDVTVSRETKIEKGTLTIAPGVKVTFQEGGSLMIAGGATLVARGTEDKPVRFEGPGLIGGWDGAMVLGRCEFAGMGAPDGNGRPACISLSVGEAGVTLRDCRFIDCGGISLKLRGPFTLAGCDVRRREGLYRGDGTGIRAFGAGKVLLEGNTFEGVDVGVGQQAEAVIRHNVVVRGCLSSGPAKSLLMEGNYVHQPGPGGSYGLLAAMGEIRDNVVRGGSWVSAQIGGTITGNVFISLPHERAKDPGGFNRNCSHEHICGLRPGSRVARNLFVGRSYGAVMGIGEGTGSGAIIRNNTFDLRAGHGHPVFLNHLPKGEVKDIVVRGNIFMRCSSGVLDEKGLPDSTKYIDWNLWAMSPGKDAARYPNVAMKGLKPGDAAFGGNDYPPAGGEPLDPSAVVVNPDVEFPFSDGEMLARRRTVTEVLDCYRKAYSLKPGSPAVDRGDPADKSDPEVKDGKPDMGALEFAK